MKFAAGLVAALAIATLSVPAVAQDWVNDVSRQIAATQTYPRSALIREDQGTVRIRVHIAGDGSIGNVEIIKESGSKILDREALRMPTKVGRVAPPPGGRKKTIDIPVTFKLS